MRPSPCSKTTDAGLRAAIACLPAIPAVATAQVVTETHKLVPAAVDGMDRFGHSVSLDGDDALIGATASDGNAAFSGAAFLFRAADGSFRHRLTGAGTGFNDLFGESVAIRNGVAVVGAFQNDGAGLLAGAAFAFDASSGVQQQRINPEQVVFVGEQPVGSAFGFSLDASDRWLAIGAPGDLEGANGGGGAVYVYDNLTGERVGKYFARDAAFADNMGWRVAVDEQIVVAGAPFDDDRGVDSGSVYAFDAESGQQLFKVSAQETRPGDMFGVALDIDEGIIAVGSPSASSRGQSAGAVYLFSAESGEQLATIFADETSAGDRFGASVALGDGRLIVGAPFETTDGITAGAAYVFNLVNFQQTAVLRASDAQQSDVFGNAVAISGDRALVGAEGDDDAGDFAGAAYLFDLAEISAGCNAADLSAPLGVLDLADLQTFTAGFLDGASLADINQDGVLDLADQQAFVLAFQVGCP